MLLHRSVTRSTTFKALLSLKLLLLTACASPVLTTAPDLSVQLDTGNLVPAFDPAVHNYEVTSLSSIKPVHLKVSSSKALSATLDGKPLPLNTSTRITIETLATDRSLDLNVTYPDRTESYVIQTLPESFPRYTVATPEPGLVSPGWLFLTPHDWNGKSPAYLMVLNDKGHPVYYRSAALALGDFKRHLLPDGSVRYSYFEMDANQALKGVNYQEGRIQILDQDLQPLKSLMLQPYHSETYNEDYPVIAADSHDTLMLGPDHYILMAYYGKEVANIPAELLKIPDSKVKVVAAVLQEIKDGQVVFQWDSTHYPEFYKNAATYSTYDSASPDWYDYMHINSVAIDPKDQNLILSMRHQNHVIKIDRKQGHILWRLGGKNSDFALTPEQQFAHQHDARLLPNGDLMLFDNSNPPTGTGTPGTSNAKRFRLDETKHTITDFQKVQPLPNQYAFAMGSAQQLSNGNLLFGWGANTNHSDVTETDATGKVLFDLRFDEQVYSYRAFKYGEF